MEKVKEKSPIKDYVSLKIEPISSHLLRVTINLDGAFTKKVEEQTLRLYQKQTVLSGFQKQKAPIKYLIENYKKEIESSTKNFIFKHMIIDFLMDQIFAKKITLANYPRLIDIKKTEEDNLDFVFNLSIAEEIELKEWKNFAFRAPKRKKYKDLDKQVTLFIKRETSLFKKKLIGTVQEEDWVGFDAILLDANNNPLIDDHKTAFWIKVDNKYITRPFQFQLIGKKIGDSFITDTLPLKNDFSSDNEYTSHDFLIKIKKITKGKNFWLDSFKTNFRLKSKIDVHKKLIEIFSYRNDVSQRKSIIEELFHLLLSKHRFEVPKHFVIRRQEDILNTLKQHPDYQVYKLQEDFPKQIELLSEKQLKEEIIIDQISYRESLKVDEKDIQNYLHLFNNNRLKEFVYFKPLTEKIEEIDHPLQTGLLKQAVLREKTLNHMIHVLTK